MSSNRLLIDEPPLQIIPSLAVRFGLNEAIFLQQLHYWLKENETKRKYHTHFRDGRWWSYNTYKAWIESSFPFWSTSTIKRAISSLESIGIVISVQYESHNWNHVKWYSIDYDKMDELIDEVKMNQSSGSNCPDLLTETNTETNTDILPTAETDQQFSSIQETLSPSPTVLPDIQAEKLPSPPAAPLPWPAPKPTNNPQTTHTQPLARLAKKGDPLDGMLAFAQKADDPQVISAARISDYPQDVQNTLSVLIDLYRWPIGAIPDRPRNGKGGSYAQWIKELRDINNIIAGYGVDALQATVIPCKGLSISHPAGITWCLAGEVGKLADRQEKDKIQREPDEPTTFTPPPEELRKAAYERLQGYTNA